MQEQAGPSAADAIRELMRITELGYYSLIKYLKPGLAEPTVRVIVPKRLIDGIDGLLVAAYQLEPERGPKQFSASRIVAVAQHSKSLSEQTKQTNTFCTGEVVEVRERKRQPGLRLSIEVPDCPPSTPPRTQGTQPEPPVSLWSQPWFIKYVGAVRGALMDLAIDRVERDTIRTLQRDEGLEAGSIQAAHSYILAEELLAASLDGHIGQEEHDRLRRLCNALDQLGWGPAWS